VLRRLRNRWLCAFLVVGSFVGVAASPALATTTIQASICSPFTGPSISEPASGAATEASSAIVKGMGEPAMAVSILDNGTSVGTTTSMPDGSLTVGTNTLVARQTDGCSTQDSAAVTVTRTAVPPPPSQPSPPPVSPAPPSSPPRQSGGAAPPILNIFTPPASRGNDAVPPTSGYPKPTITQPNMNERFTSHYVWVAGRAQPKSFVTVYVNGVEVARVVASDDGTYGVMVELQRGENTLYVRSSLDGKSAVSDTVKVQFVQPEAHASPHLWWWLWLLALLLLLLLLLLYWHIYRRRRREERTS
jgi:hypothetical protein